VKLSFSVPHWLMNVKRLEERSKLTGKASAKRSYLGGFIEVVVTVEQPPHLSSKRNKE